ncbi:unnamed protein product [Urochloa humidicola]
MTRQQQPRPHPRSYPSQSSPRPPTPVATPSAGRNREQQRPTIIDPVRGGSSELGRLGFGRSGAGSGRRAQGRGLQRRPMSPSTCASPAPLRSDGLRSQLGSAPSCSKSAHIGWENRQQPLLPPRARAVEPVLRLAAGRAAGIPCRPPRRQTQYRFHGARPRWKQRLLPVLPSDGEVCGAYTALLPAATRHFHQKTFATSSSLNSPYQ